MVLDILTASQGGTCAVIQTESCVFIPDEYANIIHLLSYLKSQIAALDDLLPSLGDLSGSWFCSGSSWLKSLLVTSLMLLGILLISCLFYKIVVSYVTQYVTRPPTKLMMAKHLEEIDLVYNSRQNNCSSVILGMGKSNRGKHFLDHSKLVRQVIQRILNYQQGPIRDFPGGAMVKNLPANAGDTGLIPGPGRSHMPRSN